MLETRESIARVGLELKYNVMQACRSVERQHSHAILEQQVDSVNPSSIYVPGYQKYTIRIQRVCSFSGSMIARPFNSGVDLSQGWRPA